MGHSSNGNFTISGNPASTNPETTTTTSSSASAGASTQAGVLDPTMAAALASDRILLFGAVEINLPGYDLCLLDGSGTVVMNGKTFVGRDATYGVLDAIKGLDDQTADKASEVTLGLIAPSTSALATLLDPQVQGSTVTISIGVLDYNAGTVIGNPYVAFIGQLDVPTITWDNNDRRIEYRITSYFERLFVLEEGRRLSTAFHQMVWPGELGLDHCVDVEQIIAWGQNVDNTVVYTRSNLPGFAETYNRT